MTSLLTVDLGNTRAKLRLWPSTEGALPDDPLEELTLQGEDLRAGLAAWLERVDGPVDVAVVSVAGRAREEELRDALAPRVRRLHLDVPPGLRNACRSPERVGHDRLFAARGALERVGRSAIVVDVGTALTVDAVERGPDGDRFLGGAIAPGPALGARALADGAAQLPPVDPAPGVPALGRDTEEAIRSGLSHGLRGAARELARRIAAEAGFDAPPVVLTGGAAPFLEATGGGPHAFEGAPGLGPLVPCPELVHLGLLAAAFGPAR